MKIYRHILKNKDIITFIWDDGKLYIYTPLGIIISDVVSYKAGCYTFKNTLHNINFMINIMITSPFNRELPYWNTIDGNTFSNYFSWWIDENSLIEFHKTFDEIFFGP